MKKLLLSCAIFSAPVLSKIDLYNKDCVEVSLEVDGIFNGFFGKNSEKNTTLFKNTTTPDTSTSYTTRGTYQASHSGKSLLAEGGGGVKLHVFHVYNKRRAGLTMILGTSKASTNHVKELFLHVEDENVGGLMIGNTKGVEHRFVKGPSAFSVGTGGIYGAGTSFYNVTSGCSVMPEMEGECKRATKIIVTTPSLNGLKFGVSYTPSTHHHGDMSMTNHMEAKEANKPFARNTVAYAVSYEAGSDKSKIELAFVGLHGKSFGEKPGLKALDRFPIRSYNVSTTLSFGPLRLGAQYIWNGKSNMLKNAVSSITPTVDDQVLETKSYDPSKAGKGKIFSLGIGYIDEKTVSVTFGWLRSWRHTGIINADGSTNVAKGDTYALSIEKVLMPGLIGYVEGVYYKTTNPNWAYYGSAISGLSKLEFTGSSSNKAGIFMVGLKIKL